MTPSQSFDTDITIVGKIIHPPPPHYQQSTSRECRIKGALTLIRKGSFILLVLFIKQMCSQINYTCVIIAVAANFLI